METLPQIDYSGGHYEATVPDTLDLAERADLALNGLGGTIDPELHHSMFFRAYCDCDPPFMIHTFADWTCDPKYAESFALMRVMSGSERYRDIETAQRAEVLSRTEDGLYWNPFDPARPWSHDYVPGFDQVKPTEDVSPTVGSASMLRTLVTWYQLTPSTELARQIREMVGSLDRIAIKRGDHAFYPDCGLGEAFNYPRSGWATTREPERETEGGEGSVLCYHGHQIQGLARWYELSGDEQALELAAELTRFCMKPKFWGGTANPDGDWKGLASTSMPRGPDPLGVAGHELGHWYTHHHARCIALRGMLQYGLATRDERVLEFVKRSYEYSLTLAIPRLGWVPVMPTRELCEGCSLGDMVALGVRLTDSGVGDYWDDVDALVRNHLVEQQLADREALENVISHAGPAKPDIRGEYPNQEWLGDVVGRVLGAYSAATTPSSGWALAQGCCTGNGTKGLYYAWEGAVREDGGLTQVNLLLNRAAKSLDVDSYLPYQGKVVIRNKGASRIAVRIPSWVERRELRTDVSGQERPQTWVGNHVLVDDVSPDDKITLSFPMRETRAPYTANAGVPDKETTYTCHFRGSTCVDISPRDESPLRYPLYVRQHMRAVEAPMKKTTRFVPDKVILHW